MCMAAAVHPGRQTTEIAGARGGDCAGARRLLALRTDRTKGDEPLTLGYLGAVAVARHCPSNLTSAVARLFVHRHTAR
jgi:hypothetical protein